MSRPRSHDFPPLTKEELSSLGTDPAGNPFPPLLTVDQAAELLQVPKATIYAWSSQGRLKGCAKRAGKHLRLHRNRLLTHFVNGGLTHNE